MGFFEFFGGVVIFGFLLIFFSRTSFLVILTLYLVHRGVPLFVSDAVGGWFGTIASTCAWMGALLCFLIETRSFLRWLKSKMG